MIYVFECIVTFFSTALYEYIIDHKLINFCYHEFYGEKTLGGVRLREKKYHFHLGHHNKNSFVGKPKDLAVHVWYVNHIGFL